MRTVKLSFLGEAAPYVVGLHARRGDGETLHLQITTEEAEETVTAVFRKAARPLQSGLFASAD